MTVEQVLVFLLAATAGIFLFLGLAQALDDRSARSRRRRRRTPDAWHGGPPPHPLLPDGIPSEASQTTVIRPPIPRAAEPRPRAANLDPPAAPARFAAELDLVMVEDAMGLCLGGKYEELLGFLEPRLAADREAGAEGQRSHTIAALHSLAGLARHALGDASAARAPRRVSARGRTRAPRPAHRRSPRGRSRSRGACSRDSGAHPIRTAAAEPRESADRARLAVFWLSWRLEAVPGDERTLELLDAAREAVAELHAEAAAAAIRRQEYGAARAIVQRAVDAGELPSVQGEVLLDLLGAAFRKEIDRLTAAAIRGGDESRAVAELGQAEALLGTMPEGTIVATHRAAVAQRIWRGRSNSGFGASGWVKLSDTATDLLFHALAMREVGRRRQRQVRDALVRTLEGLGDQRAAAVRRSPRRRQAAGRGGGDRAAGAPGAAGQGRRRVGRGARGRVIEARAAPAAVRRVDPRLMSGLPRQGAGGPGRGSSARISS